jgi:hypothetical protein
MQTVKIQEDQLRMIIREEVSEAIKKEFMKLRLNMIPEISPEEQKEIEDLYGEPTFDDAETIELDV